MRKRVQKILGSRARWEGGYPNALYANIKTLKYTEKRAYAPRFCIQICTQTTFNYGKKRLKLSKTPDIAKQCIVAYYLCS